MIHVRFLFGFIVIIWKLVNCSSTVKDPEGIKSFEIAARSCQITEPLYNVTFDLSGLRTVLNYRVNGNNNDFIEFNVCDKLKKTCDGKSNVGACYTKAGKEHIIGVSAEILLSNGRLHYNYSDGNSNCTKTEKYSLQIVLSCDYFPEKEPLTLMPYSDDQCTFYIIWKTPLGCMPIESQDIVSNECVATDDATGHTFNLLPLSQSTNHRIPDRNGSNFLINICKPILYGYEEMCPPGSSVCFVNSEDTNLRTKFINYGTTVTNPVYRDGKLSMTFLSDEKCNATTNYSSLINFVCDTSNMFGEPEFLNKKHCQYRFIWQTSLACNKVRSCVVHDPSTAFVYDLTPLVNKAYTVQKDNTTYQFGICNAAPAPCLEKTGACQTVNEQTTSLGAFNDNLMFNQTGAPYLWYKGGSVCENISKQWTTRIEFLCNKDKSAEGPQIIENTNCELVIHYFTDLVCQNEVSCKAYSYKDNAEIDLTPLISSKSNYLALVSNKLKATEGPPILYYLNVCRPLISQYGLSCPGGSAACRAKNESITPTQEQSLGFADVSLTIVDTPNGSRAQLKYFRGSTCPVDASSQLSSTIEFYCDARAGRGLPILQEVLHDCHYMFEWPTNVICPKHECTFKEQTCEIYNDELNVTLDLKQITEEGIINVKHKTDLFDVNVCGNNRKVETDYAQGIVKVFFEAKGSCKPDDSLNIELRLVCKDVETNYLSSDIYSCNLVLIKETPSICPFVGINTSSALTTNDNNNNNKPDKTDPSADTLDGNNIGGISVFGAIVITIVVVGIVLLGIFIFISPERRGKIASLFQRKTVSVQYTRVRTDEEASLLLPQPGSLSDSDDDLLI